MDDLPLPLILEILSRLNDSADLARCRLASKTLNSLSSDVRSINLLCSFDRYNKYRSPETKSVVTPFKTIVHRLVSSSRHLESISLAVEEPLAGLSYDDVDVELSDLHLADAEFVATWLPSVAGQLTSISISDFWLQSCWRRSDILSLISSCCHSLRVLELKKAWLSVDGLNRMSTVTSLALEFIRLDDEDLSKMNDCFPSLQVLNLIGVGGLTEPKIHLLHLRTCQWTVSNTPVSLSILAPNLSTLKLKCKRPSLLVIDAPLLSDFHLSIDKAKNMEVNQMLALKTLQLESACLYDLVNSFPVGRTIKNLKVDSSKWAATVEVNFEMLFYAFPNTKTLTLGPRAWSQAETSLFNSGGSKAHGGSRGIEGLKEITAYLVVKNIEITLLFIFYILEKCTTLTDVALLIHRDVESSVASNLVSKCMACCARVRWRWGSWKEGTDDAWVSDGI